MRKTFKRVTLTFLVLVLVLVLCACSDFFNESTALVIMVGNHENRIKFPIALNDVLTDVYQNKGQAYFVCVDGNPMTEYEEGVPLGQVSGEIYDTYKNKRLLKKELKPTIQSFCDAANNLIPEEPEVDTLGAFFEAQSIFANDSREKRKIMIYDTGLSTAGELNFCVGDYLSKDAGDIVEQLDANACIPNLKGIEVEWYGIGEVASPQEELPKHEVDVLKGIWKAVLEKAGAKVEFKDSIHGDDYDIPRYGQKVTVVELDSTVQKEIYFKGDSAKFVNESEANIAIDEIISVINENPQSQWCIIGCTATVRNDANYGYQKLAQDRATVVGKLLIDHGVPANRLVFCALGINNPWHVNNLDSNGKQIDELAEKNRKVVIVSVDSKTFQQHADVFRNNCFAID